MSSTPSDSTRPGDDDLLPSWDTTPPMAMPVAEPVTGDVPMALPVGMPQPATEAELELPPEAEPEPAEPEPAEPVLPTPAMVAPTEMTCPACSSQTPFGDKFCSDCGYYFSEADLARCTVGESGVAAPVAAAEELAMPAARLKGRYELKELTSTRLGVKRYLALDHDTGADVVVVEQPLASAPPGPLPEPEAISSEEELMPSFDDSEFFPQTAVIAGTAAWPSIAWERKLLSTLESPGLPAEVDYFCDDTSEYLVEEVPTGRLLWDAWDDLDADSNVKFGLLVQVAELLRLLHQANAMPEELRPEQVVVTDAGQVRLANVGGMLPLPVPPDAPVQGTLYTAPELMRGIADARANLYSFGAMLYSLHVGRELNERTDFDKPGVPKPFIPRFPDCHPAFGRLMMKTFRREVEARFPTDEAGREDATGLTELIRTLQVLRRTYDHVHLEIAAWTSTGIVRTGNEDAYALMHAAESRQDDIGEAAIILLCDGMGGYEAGEVAASLTLQSLRQTLRELRPFSAAAGGPLFATDPLTEMSRPEGHTPEPIDIDEVKQALRQALRDANRLVFQTSRSPGSKRRGMGCTAEAVYVDGRNVVVGHVGDSRVYHLHEGRLIQLTRDQTLVNRLVELGSLSAEEAETHPRRNELQQAIGGQPDVEPGVYHGKMSPGDWVIVCSDGLTNHVNARDLQQMLQSEAVSAEMAARRLVNLTLIEGATDNVTVVAVRAT